ncbi:MAG TPA: hypothetical protein DEF63_06760, partial [Cyanobacteria bacterium UBA11440]|nr:hypothetical protein [Cyanobacteria bacterium UBA11440]
MRKKDNLSELYFAGLSRLKEGCRFALPLIFSMSLFAGTCMNSVTLADEPTTQASSIYTANEIIDSNFADYSVYEYVNGTLTPKYYQISINADYLNSKYSYINWVSQNSGLKIGLPVSDSYLGYSSDSMADSRLEELTDNVLSLLFDSFSSENGGAIYNSSNENYNIKSGFIQNSATSSGGAIYNEGSLGEISSIFIGNSAEENGGALYNKGSINNINSDFEANYSVNGGALYNDENSVITNVSGSFIGNYSRHNTSIVYGGAIYNLGEMGLSDTTFIGNYAYSMGEKSFGGAIYNDGTLLEINNVEFIRNYARSTTSNGYGGAIYNVGSIGDIVADFNNNYVYTIGSFGGAIYNEANSTIKSITGEFNNNSVNSSFSTTTADAFGGAIYNHGQITNGIKNSSFLGNYAISSTDGNALGGAIYTNSDLNLVADNYNSVFSGNYTQKSGEAKDYNAIYVNSDNDSQTVLTLSTLNNGSFVFDDNISGKNGYQIKVQSSDNTGSVQFNSLVKNADVYFEGGNIGFLGQTFSSSTVHLNGGTVSFAGKTPTTYSFYSLASDGKNLTNFEINLDYNNLTQNSSDYIRVINSDSNATIYIDKLFLTYNGSEVTENSVFTEFSKEILTAGSNLKLVINPEISSALYYLGEVQRVSGLVIPTTLGFNDAVFESYEIGKNYGNIVVESNSLALRFNGNTIWTGEFTQAVEYTGDRLSLLNQYKTNSAKTFKSEDSTDVYEAKSGLGETYGEMNLVGKEEDGNKSTVDLVSHSGFELASQSELNIKDIKFINAVSDKSGSVVNISSGVAQANFENAEFINNTSKKFGGAVSNIATVGKLDADFRRNNSVQHGGAVYNTGTISAVSGTYDSNTTTGDMSKGGAIYNNGTIDKIVHSSFDSNSSTGDMSSGGAIYNNNKINTINADFSNNKAKVSGGAIYNNGTIDIITGTFDNNGVTDSSHAIGGAIYNNGVINTIINSSFTNNYAIVNNSNSVAYAGAIYTKSSLDIIANNGYEMKFSGNYIQNGSDSVVDRRAIYVANAEAKLTFDITDNSKLIFDDAIYGMNGYSILVQGDSTSSARFNSYVSTKNFELHDVTLTFGADTFQNTHLNLVSGLIDLQDDRAVSYHINSANIADGVKFNIDIITEADGNSICDTFTITDGVNSSGTLFLDCIKFNYDTLPTTEFTLRVLDSDKIDLACDFDNIIRIDANGNVEKLENKFIISKGEVYENVEVPTSITFDTKLYQNVVETITYGHFELLNGEVFDESTSQMINVKGISYIINKIEEDPKESTQVMGDALKLLSNLQTTEEKLFAATKNCNEYIASDDVLTVYGKLTLKGIDENSVINFTSGDEVYTGFDLIDNSVLTIDRMKLTGNDNYLINVRNSAGTIYLKDAYIDGDIIATGLNGIPYSIYMNGSSDDSYTTLNGKVNGADFYLNSGALNFLADTFESSNIILNGGMLNCLDKSTIEYSVLSITSENGATPYLNIDVDLKTLSSDKFNIASRSSSGVIYLNNINILDGTVEELVKAGDISASITILNTTSNNLKLALTDRAKSYLDKYIYDVSNHSSEVYDEITASTDWSKVYNKTVSRNGDIYGLRLSDNAKELVIYKDTVNDSITTSMGDTLKLVNTTDVVNETGTSLDKSFVTDNVMTYYVSDDLGETVKTLLVKGVKVDGEYSTISLTSDDGYSVYDGFELGQNSNLTLDTVKLTGNDTLITVKDSNAVLNLNNVYLEGNVVGTTSFDVNLTGTSIIDGAFKNANVILNNANLTFNQDTFADGSTSLSVLNTSFDFENGQCENYIFNDLTVSGNVLFKIDLNIDTINSDKITVNNFRGTSLLIDEFNIVGSKDDVPNFTEVIITNQGVLQLSDKALSQLEEYSVHTDNVITYEDGEFDFNEISWTDSQTKITDTSTKYGIILNDEKNGLKLDVNTDIKYSYTDEYTLSIFNKLAAFDEKTYKTTDASMVQSVARDLGQTYGKLTVTGSIDGDNISTIDLGDYKGFELGQNSKGLYLNSVKFNTNVTGNGVLINSTSSNVEVELENVKVNSASSAGSAIYSVGDVAISATGGSSTVFNNSIGGNDYVDVHITGDGLKNLNLYTDNGSKIELSSGIRVDNPNKLVLNINNSRNSSGEVKLVLNGDLGSDSSYLNEVNLGGGKLNIADNNVSTIYTETLNILKDTEFTFDINFNDKTADKFVLGNIYDENINGNKLVLDINNINFIGIETGYQTMKFKLLNINCETSDFIDLVGATNGSILLGQDRDGYNYYLRLGLHGTLIIENNESFENNPFVLAVNNTKSNTYILSQNMVINNYGVDSEENILKDVYVQSAKFTIKGKNSAVLSTANEISGITLAGTSNILPSKQALIISSITMQGFDGAIINKGGKVTLTSVNFVDNETEGNGSAIRNLVNGAYSGSVTLKGTSKKYAQLIGNFSSKNGGAIYNDGSLTLQYAQFGLNNTVYNQAVNGGAIYSSGILKLTTNRFYNNVAENGGAIYIDSQGKSSTSITSNTFLKNSASNGGAVFVESGYVNILKSTFGSANDKTSGNVAEINGGAIYNVGSVDNNKTSVSASKFYYNNAVLGGAIYNNGIMTDSKSLYNYNTADNGGAVFNENSLIVSGSSYTANSANLNGGAIYNSGSMVSYSKGAVAGGVTSSKFVGNYAEQFGGAIYNAGVMGVKSSNFVNNSALNGAGIYNNGSDASLTVISSTFTNNLVQVDGGAVYNNGDMTLNKSTVGKANLVKKGVIRTKNSNEAQNGAGVYNSGKLGVSSSTFTNNVAQVNGGAIYNSGNLTTTGSS